jgi:hypothetical protein
LHSEPHPGNRAALAAWRTDEDMDLMDWAAVAVVREQ